MSHNRLNDCLAKGLVCTLVLVFTLNVSAAVVRRGLGPEPDSLHIHQSQGLTAINLLRDLREGLVTFDAGRLKRGCAY